MVASGVTKLGSQMQNDMPKNEKTEPQVRVCMRYQLSEDRSVYFEARHVYPRQVLLYRVSTGHWPRVEEKQQRPEHSRARPCVHIKGRCLASVLSHFGITQFGKETPLKYDPLFLQRNSLLPSWSGTLIL